LPNEPRWLPIEVVIEHNRLEVEETCERHFLRLNGYDLAIEDSALWEVPVIDLIERRSTEEEFALALRRFVVER